jgi:hypothetical protein
MKKVLEHKVTWALALIAVTGIIYYVSTWMNKNWLIDKIIEQGDVDNTEANRAMLEKKTAAQLRAQLKSLS